MREAAAVISPPSKLVVCSNFGKPCAFRGAPGCEIRIFFLYISALVNILAPNEQQSLSISLEVLNSSNIYNQCIEDVGSSCCDAIS